MSALNLPISPTDPPIPPLPLLFHGSVVMSSLVYPPKIIILLESSTIETIDKPESESQALNPDIPKKDPRYPKGTEAGNGPGQLLLFNILFACRCLGVAK